MKKNRRQWKPVVRSMIALLVGLFILMGAMYYVQLNRLIDRQGTESGRVLTDAVAAMDARAGKESEIRRQFTAEFRADVRLGASALKIAEDAEATKLLNILDINLWQISDADGNVLASSGVPEGIDLPDYRKVSTAPIASPVEQDGMEFFGSALADGKTLLAARSTQSLEESIEKSAGIRASLFSVDLEEWDALYCMRVSDETIVYDIAGELTGLNIEAMELSKPLKNGMARELHGGGMHYYAIARGYTAADGEEYLLFVLTNMHGVESTSWAVCVIALIVYLVVGILIELYRVFIVQDLRSGAMEGSTLRFRRLTKHFSFDLTLFKTIRAIAAVGIALIFVLSLYLTLMENTAENVRYSDRFMDKLTDQLDTVSAGSGSGSTLEEKYMPEMRRMARLLDISDQLADSVFLTQLSSRLDAEDIYLFDKEGKLLATNTRYVDFSLDSDKTGKYYGLARVVRGYDDSAVVTDVKSSNGMNQDNDYLAIVLPGKGAILMAGYPGRDYKILNDEHMHESAMSVTDVTKSIRVLAVEAGSNDIAYVSDTDMEGERTETLGMDDTSRVPGFIGWRISQDSYAQVYTYAYNDQIIMTIMPVEEDIRSALIDSLTIAILSFLLLFTACVIMVIEEVAPPDGKSDRVFEIILPGAQEDMKHGGMLQPFMEKTAMHKLGRVVYFLTAAVLAVIVIRMLAGGLETNAVMKYVISDKWEYDLNLFAITHLLIVNLGILLLISMIRAMLMTGGSMLGARGETVARMLCSFLKYTGAIVAAFYALSCFGIDSGSLLASAGVLTLMISLGARTLIEDIIAGIFIVFEGDFKKGDVVMIDGWRGTVEEVGVRTTRIRSGMCDLKVVRNSQISGIINMTGDFSLAICRIGIGYGESLERVEAILAEELPKFANRLPHSVTDLDYMGVLELAESAVVLGVCARCDESDRIPAERLLNREMKLIFDRNNISVPFPQITLNRADKPTVATDEDKKRANMFVHGSGSMKNLWKKPRFKP